MSNRTPKENVKACAKLNGIDYVAPFQRIVSLMVVISNNL